MTRLQEVMHRIGSRRPALINMAAISDHFGDAAPYRIEDGVAIINIAGPLSNAKWSWGGTTYGDIQDQCKIAEADPNVRAVLLNVNSPGGETDNAFETAAVIAGMSKPVYAVAATMAYSAAYLLASQADKIYCTPTSGGVGSIGVYCAHMDYSGMLAKEGIKVTLISAGEGKTTGNPYEPLSPEDEDELQEDVDRLYGEFVSAVAAGRGIQAAEVVKLGARLYDGSAKALSSGLADAAGDMATAWVDLCAAIAPSSATLMRRNKGFAASAANAKENHMAEKTADATTQPTAADIEKLVNEARAVGYSDAAQIVDLCAIAGKPAAAAQFIADKKSAADVRKDLLAARASSQGEDINTTLMPGVDAGASGAVQGKAKPWGEIMGALNGKKSR